MSALVLSGCGARNDPQPVVPTSASATVQAADSDTSASSTAPVTAVQMTDSSTTATAPAPVTSTAPPSVASSASATKVSAKPQPSAPAGSTKLPARASRSKTSPASPTPKPTVGPTSKPSSTPTTTGPARPKSIRGLEIYKVGEAVQFLDGSDGTSTVRASFTITSIQRTTTCPTSASIKPVNGQFIILGISGWNQFSPATSPQPIWVHPGTWIFYPGGGAKPAIPAEGTALNSACMRNQQISEFPAGQIPASKPVRGVVVLDVASGAGSITYSDMGVESIEYRVP